MTTTQKRTREEAIELEYWLTPFPSSQIIRSNTDGDEELGVGNQPSNDGSQLPELGPLSEFGSWESVASTIDKKVLEVSNFNPVSTVFDSEGWEFYKRKFWTTPFFSIREGGERHVRISSLSLSGAVGKTHLFPYPQPPPSGLLRSPATRRLENSCRDY